MVKSPRILLLDSSSEHKFSSAQTNLSERTFGFINPIIVSNGLLTKNPEIMFTHLARLPKRYCAQLKLASGNVHSCSPRSEPAAPAAL